MCFGNRVGITMCNPGTMCWNNVFEETTYSLVFRALGGGTCVLLSSLHNFFKGKNSWETIDRPVRPYLFYCLKMHFPCHVLSSKFLKLALNCVLVTSYFKFRTQQTSNVEVPFLTNCPTNLYLMTQTRIIVTHRERSCRFKNAFYAHYFAEHRSVICVCVSFVTRHGTHLLLLLLLYPVVTSFLFPIVLVPICHRSSYIFPR